MSNCVQLTVLQFLRGVGQCIRLSMDICGHIDVVLSMFIVKKNTSYVCLWMLNMLLYVNVGAQLRSQPILRWAVAQHMMG